MFVFILVYYFYSIVTFAIKTTSVTVINAFAATLPVLILLLHVLLLLALRE